MLESRAGERWCPYARVAVQRGVTGREVKMESIPVAYNRTTMAVIPLDDEILGKHCTCIGSECAKWENSLWNILCWIPILGYWWPRMGRCAA